MCRVNASVGFVGCGSGERGRPEPDFARISDPRISDFARDPPSLPIPIGAFPQQQGRVSGKRWLWPVYLDMQTSLNPGVSHQTAVAPATVPTKPTDAFANRILASIYCFSRLGPHSAGFEPRTDGRDCFSPMWTMPNCFEHLF